MPRLMIFLISFGLSGLTGWATGWGLQMGYWLVTGAKFVTNQTNYITDSHMEWHLTARELSKELTNIDVKNHVNEDHNKDAEDYSEWSLIQEATITNQMMQNKCMAYGTSQLDIRMTQHVYVLILQ